VRLAFYDFRDVGRLKVGEFDLGFSRSVSLIKSYPFGAGKEVVTDERGVMSVELVLISILGYVSSEQPYYIADQAVFRGSIDLEILLFDTTLAA